MSSSVHVNVPPAAGANSPEQQAANRGGESPQVPDKFKNADGSVNTDALLKSYTELESRQGQPQKPADQPGAPPAQKPEGGHKLTLDALKPYHDAYIGQNGVLLPAQRAELESKFGMDGATIDAHFKSLDITRSYYHDKIHASVGGKDEYDRMKKWAETALSPEEQAAYSAVAQSGDIDMAQFWAKTMHARYKQEVSQPGYEANRRARSTEAALPFGSPADMQAAMRVKVPSADGKRQLLKYDVDPEYRELIARRVNASNFG